MIDILYIIKDTPSINGDLELLYSLRSLEQNVADFGRIYITGRCPDFIDKNKVIFTPCNDVETPMMSHWWKVQQTIDKTDISNDFVLMYDDIFFINHINLTGYPFYKRGELGEMKSGGEIYRQNLINTRNWLINEGLGVYYDYELHLPCIYNKIFFAALKDKFFPMLHTGQPISCRSVYGNMFKEYEPFALDVKLRNPEDDVPMFGDCFSVSDQAFKYKTLDFLKTRYIIKSRWEK